jgi:RHS repeat-associated protein
MTDGQGVVVWDATYRPFGEAEVNPNSTVVNNFRFPGQYYDQETGLHYNYFRDYHPGIGRYVEPDPIGLRGGTNMYAYCMNDPVNLADPSGQIGPAGMVIGAISGGIAGFVAGAQAGNMWAGVIGGAGGALIGGFVGGVGGFAFSPQVGAIVGGIVGGVIGGASGGVIAKKLEDPDASTEEKVLAMAKGAGIGIVTGTTGGLIGAAGLSIGATGYAVNLAGAVIATPIACVLGVFSGLFVGPDQEGNLTPSFWPPEIAYPLDWFPSPDIYTSGDTVARNNYVDVWVDSGGSGCPPYNWTVSGAGFHFNSVSGSTTVTTSSDLETLQLWADDTACGSAIITVADSCGGNEKTSVREPNNGGWHLVDSERCSHWERDWCAYCTCEDTFVIGAYMYHNVWMGDKACQMTEESCGPYGGGVDLRGNGCYVVGYYTPAYCGHFFGRSMWEWRCPP